MIPMHVRYAGSYRLADSEVQDMRKAVNTAPNQSSVSLQSDFRCRLFRVCGRGEDAYGDASFATAAEATYVQWLDIAGVVGAEHAATLAAQLRAGGYHVLLLPPCIGHEPPAEVVAWLGVHAARELGDALLSRAYLVPPTMSWTAETARAILTDIQREAEHSAQHTFGRHCDEWEYCPERVALADECAASASFAGESDRTAQ